MGYMGISRGPDSRSPELKAAAERVVPGILCARPSIGTLAVLRLRSGSWVRPA